MTTEQKETRLPLAGIRVIDAATVIAAPYSASILGEFGAEVIKVENPKGGDPMRYFGTPTKRKDTLAWLSEARNKKSVTLDLHLPEGVELFKKLIENVGRAVRKLPARHARKMGARLGRVARKSTRA